jgi:hypothetical protein
MSFQYTLQKMKEEMSGCRDYDTYKREGNS